LIHHTAATAAEAAVAPSAVDRAAATVHLGSAACVELCTAEGYAGARVDRSAVTRQSARSAAQACVGVAGAAAE
jgi:hypothetical protein